MNRTRIFAAGVVVWVALTAGAGGTNAFLEISARYEVIRLALIQNSTTEVAANAKAIGVIARDLREEFSPEVAGVAEADGEAVQALLPNIISASDAVAGAPDIADVRKELAELTKPLVRYHTLVQGDRPVVAYCPMKKKAWLQPDEAIGNPYAPYMLRCGDVIQK